MKLTTLFLIGNDGKSPLYYWFYFLGLIINEIDFM